MYQDRYAAGEVLADKLISLAAHQPLLLAVPRGGVVVAAPIARKLKSRLTVLITRKIGHPLNPEVAIGAVMPDGTAVWDETTIDRLALEQAQMNQLAVTEYLEVERRMKAYTGSTAPPETNNQVVVLIDDGIATGYTIYAAVKWLKKTRPARIIVAVPVAPPDVIKHLSEQADEIVCPLQPHDFMAVGMYYNDFSQTSDHEVQEILRQFS